ncbi:uncharacterized protein EV154DRAFT_515686 [Mucor mucedo]|uniref:uncharacterized protein n=1 Tax=Mucor mucedo TaxID=29922 RepID=UPI00221F0A72|nr:uncharacterized protein EV154DRAFT_515686 [Mucor mucedo]KAI7889053.1 hypothetical protein EV154DRAFT_515686 [Mucor mucedo]
MTDSCFNQEPIMLRNPTSLLAQEQIKQEEIIEIAQHLAPEQFKYEFPPKSRIMEIEAQVDTTDEFSYFDECSFTTTSTSTAAYSNIIYEQDDEDEDYYQQLMNNSARSSSDRLDRYFESFTNDHNTFVSDNQLSPLQLPTQMSFMKHVREESYDSTGTVIIRKSSQYSSPSSFLSQSTHHHLSNIPEQDRIHWDENSFIFPDQSNQFVHEKVHRSVHPYHQSDPYEDQKVIIMKISKSQPPAIMQYSNISITDEGYDDNDLDDQCKEMPIESASVFLPLSDSEQEQLLDMEKTRHFAAIKIQSVWRGYFGRKHQPKSSLKLSHRVLAGLARINDSIHCRNNNQLQDRCYELEQRLGEETAMRIAFEKAMEDMTILMDHQHKVLNERLEQEVDMRQAYERKMEQVLNQVQPLESRLRHESKARADMESMMSRVLDQLHDIKVQQKDQAEHNHAVQRQLEEATQEIAQLKKTSGRATPAAGRPAPSGRMTPAAGRITPATGRITPAAPTRSVTGRTTPAARPASAKSTVTATSAKSTTTSSRLTSKRTITPTTARPSIRPALRSTTPAPPTTTPLRKTVINRKL